MKFVSFSFRGIEQSGIVMGIAMIDLHLHKFQSEATHSVLCTVFTFYMYVENCFFIFYLIIYLYFNICLFLTYKHEKYITNFAAVITEV